MKNKKITASLSIVVIGILFMPLTVFGAAATFAQNSTVQLTIGGTATNFTIAGGTAVDSVVTSTTQVTVVMSGGQSFTLSSADGFHLINDSGFDYSCPTGSASTLCITFPSST